MLASVSKFYFTSRWAYVYIQIFKQTLQNNSMNMNLPKVFVIHKSTIRKEKTY